MSRLNANANVNTKAKANAKAKAKAEKVLASLDALDHLGPDELSERFTTYMAALKDANLSDAECVAAVGKFWKRLPGFKPRIGRPSQESQFLARLKRAIAACLESGEMPTQLNAARRMDHPDDTVPADWDAEHAARNIRARLFAYHIDWDEFRLYWVLKYWAEHGEPELKSEVVSLLTKLWPNDVH